MRFISNFKTCIRSLKTVYVLPVLITVIACVIVACAFHVPHRIFFSFREWRHSEKWKVRSLWLPEYEVALEAVPVEGVTDNLSGLTWNSETKTLFAVVNNPAEIVELSITGVMLRRIKLYGVDDPEAIEYIGNAKYIVADERTQKIICITIDGGTREVYAQGAQRLSLGMDPMSNTGLEGLAWNFVTRKLYAAKERNPVHIYEITGFPQEPGTAMDLAVATNKNRDQRLFISDVSGLDFNLRYQHLIVLSDASRLVIEVNTEGEPVSSLSLLWGHGLNKPVPQAEGIAMDDTDTLYMVSEPNLFYVFRRKSGKQEEGGVVFPESGL